MRPSLALFFRPGRSAWAKVVPDASSKGKNSCKGKAEAPSGTNPTSIATTGPLHPPPPSIRDPYLYNLIQKVNERLDRQDLQIAVPLILKAGINTLSLALLLCLMRRHRRAYKHIIDYLHQLRWIRRPAPVIASPNTPPRLLLPPKNLDVLALASFLLSLLQPPALGTPHYNQKWFAKLMVEINAVLPPADAQRLGKNFLTTRVGGQVRLARNIAAHEVSLAAFLAAARAQQDAEKSGVCPPHPDWAEALWLWKMVEGGNGSLDESSFTPYHLTITLYNSLCLKIPPKRLLTTLTVSGAGDASDDEAE
ncbi:hypothetical protein C8F04DRAFT_1097560 [Mycena alexandri]|uniref:Uncharacterized protein n=1 Tax=Mycena alexandri TaxID=1745969 RepID=A0AAD6X811_9AGAR|nr:hypothetical protein C8F04DRAFT_1097560 [Mycena alexandri]